jgi:hypothetical protein
MPMSDQARMPSTCQFRNTAEESVIRKRGVFRQGQLLRETLRHFNQQRESGEDARDRENLDDHTPMGDGADNSAD